MKSKVMLHQVSDMLPIFETPIFVTLIIVFFLLFFFVLFLTEFPEKNGKHQTSTDTSKKVAKKNRSECTMFGFLEKLPKGDPIPDECMSCRKLVECLMKKNAFDWYSGQNSAQISKNGRINGTETPKHVQE